MKSDNAIRKNNKCIISGSFDPFTIGHYNLLLSALEIFEYVYVVVADNRNKNCIHYKEARVRMINDFIFNNIKLHGKAYAYAEDGLISDFIDKKKDVNFVVRGIRDAEDAMYECKLADINSEFCNFKTILIPTKPSLKNISSSLVKEFIYYKKDISYLVPKEICKYYQK